MNSTVKLPTAIARQKKRVEEILAAQQTEDQLEQGIAPETLPPDTTVVEAPVVDKTKTVEYWEHRFKTSEGIFNAEKNRLQAEINRREERLNEQGTRLANLEGSLAEIERKAPKKYDLRQYLSEEEIETLDGQQLQAAIKVAVNAATEEAEARIKKHIDPIRDELNNSKQEVLQAKIDAFWVGLEAALPNWRDVNNDPTFHEWLELEDVMTGLNRQSALLSAQNSLNLKRVVAIFNAFLKDKQAASPQDRLARMVQPDSRMPQPVAGDVDDDIFVTRSQIKDHYNKMVNGYYSRRPRKEKEDMERRISIATAKGNVLDR